MRPLLDSRVASALFSDGESGLLIDGHDYFLALHRAASQARHHLLLLGWQFDSDFRLLRGEEAERAPHPSELVRFLSSLCEARPELRVYILAWDYSVFYALEREWLQRYIFEWKTSDRVHFAFDGRLPKGAAQHQKLVVVDGVLAFTGGIDVACGRWDDRRHLPENPLRVDRGRKRPPHHEVMCWLTGSAARHLERAFVERWHFVTGETLELEPDAKPLPLAFEGGFSFGRASGGLHQTRAAFEGLSELRECQSLYLGAIAAAERLIYVEAQYFTAQAIAEALIARMRDARRPPPEIVIVMPRGADTPKEQVVLGRAQRDILLALHRAASETGTELRVFNSLAGQSEGQTVATFIHSKLVAVDDRLLTIGSANFTNRSLGLDTELNVSWEALPGQTEIARRLAEVRASLLAEHAGIAPTPELARTRGLVAHLDLLVAGGSRLCPVLPVDERSTEPRLVLPEKLFDPERPLEEIEIDRLFP